MGEEKGGKGQSIIVQLVGNVDSDRKGKEEITMGGSFDWKASRDKWLAKVKWHHQRCLDTEEELRAERQQREMWEERFQCLQAIYCKQAEAWPKSIDSGGLDSGFFDAVVHNNFRGNVQSEDVIDKPRISIKESEVFGAKDYGDQ